MNRYYHKPGSSHLNESSASTSSNKIVLPEYIPLAHDSSDSSCHSKDLVSFQSTSAPTQHSQSPSTSRREEHFPSSSNRNQISSRGESSRHNSNDHGSNKRQTNRDSYRSPRPTRHRSPVRFAQSPPSRSRSPNQRPRRDNDYDSRPPVDQRNASSVFDRMSSPPLPKRRYMDSCGPRRSAESSHSNGSHPQFVRTLNGGGGPSHGHPRSYEESSDYQNFDPQLIRPQRERSPMDPLMNYLAESGFAHDNNSVPMIREETIHLRDLRERLLAAESHCIGLERTVVSYEREIFKLRTLVNGLIEDFESLQNRLR